ncbi:hypothetical protein [Marinobacter sp. S0848L]|uniref:hypothetical protein n=1 Tax=Marinobacter sp. S0848L TaxID=2926423 RepID=UPI001FF20C81|nr:hypothetical protein [Marinobacter sp. S0848L]MCK0105871.1 hypothetical protein [Marinobacter sp. S0848L]
MSEFDEGSLDQSGSWVGEGDDNHSVASRARVRAQLQADIEAFLQCGGKIEEVDSTLKSNASRKVDAGFNNRTL